MPSRNPAQAILISVAAALLLGVILAIAYGAYRTWRTRNNPDYARFLSGELPAHIDEGLWNGTAEELGEVSWKGKKFLPESNGINVFESMGEREEKYRFTFAEAPSLSDETKRVIRIDYNQQGNPLWLRFIVDEMTSEEDGKLLGAVYITAIPGMPLRMGYFRLERSPNE